MEHKGKSKVQIAQAYLQRFERGRCRFDANNYIECAEAKSGDCKREANTFARCTVEEWCYDQNAAFVDCFNEHVNVSNQGGRQKSHTRR